MTHKLLMALALVLGLSGPASLAAAPAQPTATITVTSKLDTTDPGKCRLRDAIIAANTNTATGDCPAGAPGLDTISLNLGVACNVTPCLIHLTSALPSVTEDLTLNGNQAIISGEQAFRIFDLGPVTVSLTNLRLANANVSGTGGAINMSSAANTTLTLDHVFFSGNHATSGGAIYQPRGILVVGNSNFSGNTAGENGGALLELDAPASTVTIANSVFISNTAGDSGGALFLTDDAVISNSTFARNSAPGGGAIAHKFTGALYLSNSLFDQNTSTTQVGGNTGGGALYVFSTTVTITNVTFSGNSALTRGGAIIVRAASLSLNNTTLTGNTADSDAGSGLGDGGGLFNEDSAIQVQNSIIAGNFDTPNNAGPGNVHPDCSGTFTSLGYNLIGRNDGCAGFVNGVNADQVGASLTPIDPLLAALAANGGPTQTHALLPGSPALNAGNPLTPGSGGFACAATDQRGIARPQAGQCDIGAFESQLLRLFLPLILR